jgi:uncharacterized protein Veg
MSEYFGIVARASSGSTAAMELVSGRKKAAERIAELIESDHTVSLFTCTQVTFELTTEVTVHINP